MALQPGDPAPDFTLPDETGTPQALRDYLAVGPVVLFFYPAANTPGCTVQACHFRDLAAEFEAVGAQRLGISTDSVEAQKSFADKRGFGYPLLSDQAGDVAKAFGVKRGLLGVLSPVKRSTFVIGTDGVILDVVVSETNMNAHADRALAALGASENA
jgi:thioredoxin-dependent peroxiredoxin